MSFHRQKVNKAKSAKRFANQVQKTKRINLASPPMRGGIRL